MEPIMNIPKLSLRGAILLASIAAAVAAIWNGFQAVDWSAVLALLGVVR